MSQPTSNPKQYQAFLKKGVFLIGSLSLLSTSLFWTQARADETGTTPDAASEVSSPDPIPAPRIDPAPAFSARTIPRASVSRQNNEANPVRLAAPKISVPSRQEPTLRTVPNDIPSIPPLSRQGQNSYIDTTSYQPDPSPRLTQPSKVVLSERSSGCQAVSQNGQLTSGNCGQVIPQRATLATIKPLPPRAIAQRPRLLNPYITAQNIASPLASSASRPVISQKAIAANSLRTNVVMNQVVSLEPIARRGLNIALEPLTEYNRATSSYYQTPADQRRTDMLFPLPVMASITSAFGWRVHPVSGTTRMHEGTDLGAPEGTPVLAAYPGEVATADYEGGYGLLVVLRHLEGTQESRYGHLSEIFVRPGDKVEKGAVIGLVGSTGLSTGPHLHFEWRHLTQEGWVAVDAGQHLEYALGNLMQSMQVAQAAQQPGS